MTKKARRIFTWVLAAAIIMTVMCGCQQTSTSTTGSGSTTATTKATTATTAQTIDKVTNVMRSDYQVNFAGTDLDQWIQDTFGIEIELVIIDPASYTDKFQIMWNTGDLPDISQFNGVSAVEVDNAGDKGILLDGFAYLDYMPALKEKLIASYDSLGQVVSSSGKLYRLPTSYGMGAYLGTGQGMFVRADILEANGYDLNSIESTSDLYDMLEVLKAVNPGKYVLSCRGNIHNLSTMGLHSYGISIYPATWRESSKEYVPCYRQETFKEWLTFWANAYADDILHPEFLNMGSSELWQNLYDGSLTCAIDTMANINHVQNNSSNENADWQAVVYPKFNGTRYGIPSYTDLDATGNNIVISSECKVPEKVMAFIDWTYTNEGFLRTQFGIEGEDYILLNEDPLQFMLVAEGNEKYLEGKYTGQIWTADERIQRMVTQPYYFYGWYSTNCRWSILGTKPDGPSRYQLSYEAYDAAGLWLPPEPSIALVGDEATELTDLYGVISTLASEAISKIIIGQMSVEDWETVLARIEDAGYDRLMELYDKSYQEYQKIVVPEIN